MALSTEQTDYDFHMTTQLTSSSVIENTSFSSMALTYSSTVIRKRFKSSSASTYDITTGKFKDARNISAFNKTEDIILNQASSSKWTIAGIASGGGVILVIGTLILLLFCRFRRKRKYRKGRGKYNAAAQTLNAPDNELVVTDNLVYNLIDPLTEAHSVFGIEAVNATENDDVENNDLVFNVTNVEPNTEGIGYSKAENVNLVALSDEDKMELYANKRISKQASIVKTKDSLYANG